MVANPTRGYVAFIIALTFMCNVFLGEETRAVSLSAPLIIKEFGITPSALGFAQTVANWVGLIGWCGSLLIADGLGRKPAFLTVLLGFSLTAPLIGISGSFAQLTVMLSLAAVFRNTGTINYIVLAETAPPSIRSFVLAFLNSAVVLAYMISALLAGVIIPAWGWRAMFFILVVYLAAYPSFSAWQTAWLVNEVKIPYAQSTSWIAIWLGASAIAYWLCGWLANQFGKKVVIPVFAGLGGCFFLAIIAGTWTQTEIFWLGLGLNFFVTGHYGAGSYAYVNELFPAEIRGSVQASFAVFVGFTVSFAPTIPPLIAQNQLEHISRGFVFPMVLTFAAALIFLFVAPETARKPLADIIE